MSTRRKLIPQPLDNLYFGDTVRVVQSYRDLPPVFGTYVGLFLDWNDRWCIEIEIGTDEAKQIPTRLIERIEGERELHERLF